MNPARGHNTVSIGGYHLEEDSAYVGDSPLSQESDGGALACSLLIPVTQSDMLFWMTKRGVASVTFVRYCWGITQRTGGKWA